MIVLDAVGAGALPDAAQYGDEGSDTLGNVARAVGGIDLPNMEALGLGNVEPLEGCPPQPGAPAVAGRLVARSKGKDTTTGHWELMGVVTATAFPTYPHGFPHDVIDPFMHAPAAASSATGRRRGRRSSRSSARSIRRRASGSSTPPATPSSRSRRTRRPLRSTSCTTHARSARDPHRQARRRTRHRAAVHRRAGNYTRTPNRHDYSLEPHRPNYLTLLRDGGVKVHGVGKIRDIFAHQDIDESYPTKSNIEGIQQTEQLLQELDEGFIFVNLVETDMLWGHRNDPVNFHRCLQDFDRRLPDLLDALRPGDLLILTSDHGCDPTTPSTDHSREHAMLIAYVAGRNASGQIHEGEFADVAQR